MTLTRLIVHTLCGAAIGFVAGKLLPPAVMAAAALILTIWAGISVLQIKRRQKEVEEVLRQIERLRAWK